MVLEARFSILVLCLLCSCVFAKLTTWTGNAGDGKWNTAGNWNNGAPAANDDVTISSAPQVIASFSGDVFLNSLSVTGSTVWLNLTTGNSGSYSIDSVTVKSSTVYFGAQTYAKDGSSFENSVITFWRQYQGQTFFTSTNTAFIADLTTPGYDPNFYFTGNCYVTLDQTNFTSIFVNADDSSTVEIRKYFWFNGVGSKSYMQMYGATVIFRGDLAPTTINTDKSPNRPPWVAFSSSRHIIYGKVLFNYMSFSDTDGSTIFNVTDGVATFYHPKQASNFQYITGSTSGRLILREGLYNMNSRVNNIRLTILKADSVAFPYESSLSNAALDIISSSVRLSSRSASISALSVSGSVTFNGPATFNYFSVFSGSATFRNSTNITMLYMASGSGVTLVSGSSLCTNYFLAKSGSILSGIQSPTTKTCGCNEFSLDDYTFSADYTCGGSYPAPPAVPSIDGYDLPPGFATSASYTGGVPNSVTTASSNSSNIASQSGNGKSSGNIGLIVGIVVGVVVVAIIVVVVIILVIRKRDGGSHVSYNNNNHNEVELRNTPQAPVQTHTHSPNTDYDEIAFRKSPPARPNPQHGSGGRVPPNPNSLRSEGSYGVMPNQSNGQRPQQGSNGRVPPNPQHGSGGRVPPNPNAPNGERTGYKPIPGPRNTNPTPDQQAAFNRNTRDTSFSSLSNPWIIDPQELVYGKEIGRGAFGVVYKGQWRKGEVAIKQLLSQEISSTEGNDFRKEVQLMMSLRPHGNVVQFYGITTEPLAVVCEYLPLGSLLSMLRSDSRIPTDKLNKIIVGIARGMFHLHSEKIIHRDLAARNVLLGSDWEPKITDFGLSRIGKEGEDDATTKSNTGPLKWMAPECLQLRKYSKKSDVWAYGITLIEILTRQSPYGNMESIQVAAMVMYGDLKPEIPSNAPPKIKKVMELCFKNNYLERPDFDAICDMLK